MIQKYNIQVTQPCLQSKFRDIIIFQVGVERTVFPKKESASTTLKSSSAVSRTLFLDMNLPPDITAESSAVISEETLNSKSSRVEGHDGSMH